MQPGYAQVVDYMQNAALYGSKKNGLENTRILLARLGNPHAGLRYVHVAGTNGKGSVCAFTESILRHAGYRTGLFTSPYLERFNERFRIDFAPTADEDITDAGKRVIEAAQAMAADGLDHPTFFELVTACAFLIFKAKQVDVAIMEVGVGGDLDATNVIDPLVCAITSIGLDHTGVLGDTPEQIAVKKAGIIKPGVPCVLSPALADTITRQIADIAYKRQAMPVVIAPDHRVLADDLTGQCFASRYGTQHIALPGAYQRHNALCALGIAGELKKQGFALPPDAVARGLTQARWPGRMELLRAQPPFLLDGAHNPQGAQMLAQAVEHYLPGVRPVLITGALAGKDYAGIAQALAGFAGDVLVVQPDTPRALGADALAAVYQSLGLKVQVCATAAEALDTAMDTGLAVVVAGSLYLAGEMRRLWAGLK